MILVLLPIPQEPNQPATIAVISKNETHYAMDYPEGEGLS
jgi:hypothetical protein